MRRVAQNCAEAWRRLLWASPVSSSATSVAVLTLMYLARVAEGSESCNSACRIAPDAPHVWMLEMNRKAITSAQLSEIAPPTAVASVRSRGTLR